MFVAINKFVIILIFLSFAANTFALKQYRCGAVVQYRPCDDDRSIPTLLEQKRRNSSYFSIQQEELQDAESSRARMDATTDPIVFSTKYKFNTEHKVGIWTGFVYGQGPVVLRLRLNVAGSPPQSFYMGKAVLSGRHTPFEFRSDPPPKGVKWSWSISAKNDQ